MSASKSHGVQRVIAKIENSVKNGNYYEAHQMYKTLYFRYLAQKKYAELLNLLYEGSTVLLEHDQQSSGVELGRLFIDVLVKSKTKPNEDYIRKVAKIFSLVRSNVPEKDAYLSAAVRWSDGSPLLHQCIAQSYWKEKNYAMARKHFLRSYDGSSFGAMLVELHELSGYTSEVDLFIAQVVLQCLCLKNERTAAVTFQCYTTQHPCITNGPPYLLPLLNFIWFLLQAIETGRLAAFTILCQQYQVSIERDPTYTHYLDKIGQIFFNKPSPSSRPSGNSLHGMAGGLFGNIFQSLVQSLDEFSDEDDDVDDDEDEGDDDDVIHHHHHHSGVNRVVPSASSPSAPTSRQRSPSLLRATSSTSQPCASSSSHVMETDLD